MKINWYLLKLPSMIMLIVVGLALEALATFPFVMVYHWERLTNRRP
jgi:hypothetical protein